MLAGLVVSFISFGASVVVAQSSSPVIVCVAGQCLQGLSNVSIGTKLSAGQTSMLLLPGQYTTTTNPALLHGILTSPSASLTPSPGFNTNSTTVSLPLNVALQPGLSTYPGAAYSGSGSFTPLPSTPSANTSTLTPLSSFSSLSLAANTWTALSAGTSRLIVWDSIPDISQLPASSISGGAFSLLDIQLSTCSPPCSSSGVCSPTNGTCACLPGFTGASCESCAPGFFGATCQPCPTGCTSCDDGLSGTGVCKTPVVANAPSTCNCLNGVCNGNTCTCTEAWATATNGTQCAACAPGYYLDSQTGSCQICGIGCSKCVDGDGNCSICNNNFVLSPDPTKCFNPSTVSSPSQKCASGTFSDGKSSDCFSCSPACKECTGGTAADCLLCANGTFMLNGVCVAVDANGVCAGSKLVANNAKNECDACGAKCTACKIPSFSSNSNFLNLQCTGCVPGSVLSQGKCVDSCPSGTFLDPKDNLTCTACDTSCGTCVGSATNCLTCTNNLFALAGKCVATCPSNTILSSGTCQPCHPDCATCTGTSFNQCSSCPPNRPVLTGGRCMPTCAKAQFFDKTSSTCVACDSSCSSCSGSGPENCLACAGSNMVLKAGTCTAASCTSGSSVVPGLGLCLSDIVNVSAAAGNTVPPGLNSPTPTSRRLAWWEILLMALGCAFIFLVILMCWRRRARNQRAKQTQQFANAKSIDHDSWRMKLVRFGERLFGHKPSVVVGPGVGLQGESEEIKLLKLRNAEEARHNREMEKLQLIDKYDYPRSVRSMSTRRVKESFHDAPSIYSQVTGQPRTVPEPRMPIRNGGAESILAPPNISRFSDSTISTWVTREAETLPAMPTAASVYAAQVSADKTGASGGSKFANAWMVKPTPTGASDNNPFRKQSL